MTEQYREDVACRDCTRSPVLRCAIKLYESTVVHNANEALTVLFHGFMLQNRFSPKDVPEKEKYRCMPEKWNADGVYKIFYTHFCCPKFSCCVTCVPLYNTISVHGTICDIDCPDSINFKVQIKQYVRQKPNFNDIFEVFHNVEGLLRNFMDNFHLPLLNLLHESHGISPLYGLHALLDEMKMYILEFLPVGGVLSMSGVNKKFNALTNSPALWKHLYLRDYAKGGVQDFDPSSAEVDWKEMYKKEYRKKRRRPQLDPWPRLMPDRLPNIVPLRPYLDGNFGYDFDPRFPFTPPFHALPSLPPSLSNYFRRLI